ncbi:hypothetical protein R75465_07596 [Paraburkholderia aspalathi]|uniref:hypothetical protein n=1 Tax=Paraburkholderia aspalathi TaxID=1324617 RepID=UPI001B254919|nr:hypothetical protein [Paraburkholderia aspalathi]CAE6859682.1 hypothetical protein R75465_07596 [Paraburkholderia aspalathi]
MIKKNFSLLYIVGWCRSGSTIVGNLLNEVNGFFHAGELHYLWRNTKGLGSNTVCGCGAEITRCSVWSEVIGRLGLRGDWSRVVSEVIDMQKMCRTRHTWQILRSPEKRKKLESYTEAYLDVCDAIAEITGSRVLIDGGKFASEAALLRSSGRVSAQQNGELKGRGMLKVPLLALGSDQGSIADIATPLRAFFADVQGRTITHRSEI